MLWGPRAERIVTESFQRAKEKAERVRQEEAAARLEMLEDDWHDALMARVRKVYASEVVRKSVAGFLGVGHNVMKRIAQELSTVYKWGAAREFDDPLQDEIARLAIDELEMDATLEAANLYLNVLRDLIIVPTVIDPGTPRARGKLEILTPDRLSVIQHPEDPTTPVAFSYQIARNNTLRDRNGLPATRVLRMYADEEEWALWDEATSRWVWRRPHNLGRLPGVILHADKRRDSFFNGTPFRDAVDETLMVNLLMLMMMHLQKYQSEIQPTFDGLPKDVLIGQEVGGHTIWTGQGTWGTLDLQASVEQYLAHINARIGFIAVQYGLAADAYKLEGTFDSGFKFRMKRLPLLEARSKQIKIWRRAEKDLWPLVAETLRANHPLYRRLDPAATFSINFSEDPLLEDPLIRTRVYAEQIDLNLMSHVDALMAEDPDLDRAQAIAKMTRIQEERLLYAKLFQQTNMPADATNPGVSPQQNGGIKETSNAAPGE